MGDFIIIALLVSSFWLLLELLRTAGIEKMKREEISLPAGELGKEELLRCADSFEQLSGIYRRISEDKEETQDQDLQEILYEVQDRVCRGCSAAQQCWGTDRERSWKRFCKIAENIRLGREWNTGRRQALQDICVRGMEFLEAVQESYERARLNQMWRNRLLENRRAVADQLSETARIIKRAAVHIYDVKRVEGNLRQMADVRLRMNGMVLKDIWCVNQQKGLQLYVTIRTARKGRCIRAKEAAGILSEVFCCRLMPDQQGRSVIRHEYSTLLFLTEPVYRMSGGVARTAKDGEVVSGDNFALFARENGQMIMSISDGMGSGIRASRESETVIELLEQFLGSGFDKEAAIKLIHASLLLQTGGQASATVDLCMTDLYTGECEFLKIGASTTFVKRNGWVESIASTSMPMGILREVDYECTKKKLESGDYIVMVSDGVMDAIPGKDAEEIVKDYLLETKIENARELAKSLLQHVLNLGENQAQDDMTVLVGGFWKQ